MKGERQPVKLSDFFPSLISCDVFDTPHAYALRMSLNRISQCVADTLSDTTTGNMISSGYSYRSINVL
ncbi:MAG: hypothetical protein JXM72_00205 [Deltaproteobacteria bacterium]|nr:hypothetical protein [Deltaproteobacteria bacterium]